MATVTERLRILITSEGVSQSTAGINKATGAFGGLSQAVGVTRGQLALMGGTAVIGALASAANAASNLNEQVSASDVIFGDGAAQVQKFAQDASSSFGISERAALEAANSFASLFKNAGAMDQDAARFSITLTKLAADIGSLRNMSREDVALALRSGLTGELEPLRRLGIIMNDNTVKAKALEMGLADASGEVDDGAKVFARLNLILQQTGDAQGNYALTADGMANAQQRMKAELEDLQATIGQMLSPALAEGAKNLSEFLDLANTALAPLGGLGKAFGYVNALLNPVGFGISKITGLFGDNKSAAEKAAEAQQQYAADADAAAQVQREQTAATEAQTKALEKSRKALDEFTSAQERLPDVIRARERAERGVIEAERELAEIEARGRIDKEAVARANERIESTSKAVAEAQKDEARSARDVETATRDVAAAQKALEAVKKGASPRDLAEAEMAVRDARRDNERALLDAKKAEQDALGLVNVGVLADGQKVATTEDKRRAELDLQTAQDRVKRSAWDLEDAEKQLQAVRDKGKPGTKDYEDALDNLTVKQEALATKVQDQATAHQNVIDKKKAAITAHDELREAETGDPEFDENLRKARQSVADAHWDADKAKKAEKAATEDLNAAEATLANDRRIRKAELDQMLADEKAAREGGWGGRGGTAGPGTGPGPGNNPLGALAGLSAMQAGVMGGMGGPPPTFGEQPWQRAHAATGNTFVTVVTGADPNATVRAIEQYAASNGGKPRK